MQGVTTQVSALKSNTDCTTALNKNPDTRGLAPSLIGILNILLQTARAILSDTHPFATRSSSKYILYIQQGVHVPFYGGRETLPVHQPLIRMLHKAWYLFHWPWWMHQRKSWAFQWLRTHQRTWRKNYMS